MIKEFIHEIRIDIANFIKPKGVNFLTSGFNAWNSVYGKMQPTDFVKQVESNESWVYACVMAIAESCAMQKLELYIKRGDTTDEVKEHVFLDLMANVNPFMNNFELRELTEMYQLLCGNAYWYLVKNGLSVPKEIWIVPAQYMTVIPDTSKFIKGYSYNAPGQEPILFDVDEIVHFKYPNPNNIFYGMSPLLAAAYAVDTDEYMNKYQVNAFKNSGMPAAVLSSEQIINEPDAKRMREQWKQLYGGSEKAGKVAILSKGLKFEPIQMTAQELSYIQSKNVNRDTILGIFRVPKSVLGLTEDVNRANAEATEYIFSLRCIKPKLIRSQEKINEQIMPLYEQAGNNYLFVEYADPVPLNKELNSKIMQTNLATGYSSINEEREKNGDKPVEWGNVPILPMGMAALGSPAPEPAPEEPIQESIKTFTKERVWFIYKARYDNETTSMKNLMIRLFRQQKAKVMRNFNSLGKAFQKADVDQIIFEIDEWADTFTNAAKPKMTSAYAAGVKHGNRIAGLGIDFNMQNPETVKWLKEKLHKFSFDTNDTTIKQLKEELEAGYAAGETNAQLADRITKVFDFAEKYRSLRIARTEMADCENKGIFDLWDTSEVVTGKEWLHGGGGDTPRPEHVKMNGERRELQETFSNGLLYPGDQSTDDPGEVCNCTCTILPITTNT